MKTFPRLAVFERPSTMVARALGLAAVLIIANGYVAQSSAAINEPIRTQSGLLTGVPARDPAITVYKGIPYAAPYTRIRPGQSRPISKESTVPETAPTANKTAATRDQRCASSSASGSPWRTPR